MAFKDLSRLDASDAGYSLEFVASLPLANTSSLFIIGGREYFSKLSGLALCSRLTSASNAAAACDVSDPGNSTTLLVADAGNTRIHRFSINGTDDTTPSCNLLPKQTFEQAYDNISYFTY